MMRKPAAMLVFMGFVCVALLVTGCETEETEVAVPEPQDDEAVRTASDLAVELTYPQSDDEQHYVARTEPGEVTVTGVVSGPQPPEIIEVNGATVRPYEVEHITPYGQPTDYPVYRFRAPVVMQPEDEIVVVARDPYDGVEYAFVPDTDATTNRWDTLADNDPVLADRLGSSYYASQAYDEAVTHLSRAAERENAPWALYDLGMTYLAMERPDDAIDAFNRAEPVYATMPDLYYGRGLTYSTTDRLDDAIADFVQSSDLAPDWAEPLVALGMTHHARDMLADAADDYGRAIDVWPEWAAPYYGLAQVRLEQDRVDDALPLIHEAEQRGPWREEHHEALARMLYEKGNYVAARRQLEIAEKLGNHREEWWDDVYRETPEYQEYDGWPWRPRIEDDGYRVPRDHPWYHEDRPRRERPGRGGPPPGTPDGPPRDVPQGPPRGTPDGPPGDVEQGGPPGMGDGGPGREGPRPGADRGPDRGGPPPTAGDDGPDRGGPPAGAGGSPPAGRGR
ncbi:MAG: tetratricopeptide repeat protein [Armatimonadota bacterium]